MNRWICLDFYEEKWREDFQKWQREMKYSVIPDYNRYNIKLSSVPRASIRFLIGNGEWRFYMRHLELTGLDGHIWSFIDPHFQGPRIPNKYWYSNGSRNRADGTYGWN